MPTEPYKPILDPEFSIVGSKAIIDLAAPLLREAANHATHAFQRCQTYTGAMGGIEGELELVVIPEAEEPGARRS